MIDLALIVLGFILGSTSIRKLPGDLVKTKHHISPKVAWPVGAWLKAILSIFDFLKTPLLLLVAQSYSPYTAVWTAAAIISGECFPAKKNIGRGVLPFLGSALILAPQFFLLGAFYPLLLIVLPYRYISFLALIFLFPFVLIIFNAEPTAVAFAFLSLIILPLRQMRHINNYFIGTEATIMQEFKRK